MPRRNFENCAPVHRRIGAKATLGCKLSGGKGQGCVSEGRQNKENGALLAAIAHQTRVGGVLSRPFLQLDTRLSGVLSARTMCEFASSFCFCVAVLVSLQLLIAIVDALVSCTAGAFLHGGLILMPLSQWRYLKCSLL